MKRSREFVFLAVIILAAAVFILFRTNSKIEYTLPDLQSIDFQSIDRIVLSRGEEQAVLVLEENIWKVLPGHYRADQQKVKSAGESITEAGFVDLISESAHYSRYGLDEESMLRAAVFEDEKLLRELYIGNSSTTGNYTYARIPDDPRVFSLRGNPGRVMMTAVESWRDKTVLSFSANSVTGFTWETEEQKTQFVKNSTEDGTVWKTGTGYEGDDVKIGNVIRQLSYLKAGSFLDADPENLIGTLFFMAPDPCFLKIYGAVGNSYPVESSLTDTPVLVPDTIINSFFEAVTED
ncbi:MAG: DUF4340 domain-containing protein [Spirochaetales bacterium]|nr:DUF4340 domain-containing protein [Spirochaetales bacterium]